MPASRLAATTARAEDANFPDHPVRVIVSVPAGGGVDTVTRIVAAKVSAVLGQPLPVENKSGAAGSVAADYVFHADPDGYTLLASQPAPITTNPFLYKVLNYDPTQLDPGRDHVPRPERAAGAAGLSGEDRAGADRLRQSQSGQAQLRVAGHRHHLASDRPNCSRPSLTLKLVHVPYKGTAPALNDLIASHVDLLFTELADLAAAQQSRQGENPCGHHQAARRGDPGHPDAGRGRRARLRIRHLERADRAAENAARHRRQAQRRGQQGDEGPANCSSAIKQLSLSPGGGTPAEMAAFIKAETQRWGEVIHAAGIQPE